MKYAQKRSIKMYIPKSFEVTDLKTIRSFIDNIQFGSIISINGNNIVNTYVPITRKTLGDKDILIAHFAKPNKHWEFIDGGKHCISFLGPHLYISHTDYGGAVAVPTWNYAVVNAHCSGKIVSTEQTKNDILQLLEKNEGMNHGISEDLLDKFVPLTVGMHFQVEKYECKFKFSQNRKKEEFSAMIASIAKKKDLPAKSMGLFIEKYFDQIQKEA